MMAFNAIIGVHSQGTRYKMHPTITLGRIAQALNHDHCFNEMHIPKVEHNTRRLNIYFFYIEGLPRYLEIRILCGEGVSFVLCFVGYKGLKSPHPLPPGVMETLTFSHSKNLKVGDFFPRRVVLWYE